MYEVVIKIVYSLVAIFGVGHYVFRESFTELIFTLSDRLTWKSFKLSRSTISYVLKCANFSLLIVLFLTIIWTRKIDITQSTLSLFSRVVGLVTQVDGQVQLPPNLNLDTKFFFYGPDGDVDMKTVGGELNKFSKIVLELGFKNDDSREVSFKINSILGITGTNHLSFDDRNTYLIPAGKRLPFPILHMTDMSVLAEGLKKDSSLPIVLDLYFSYGYENEKEISRRIRIECRSYVREIYDRNLNPGEVYYPRCGFKEI